MQRATRSVLCSWLTHKCYHHQPPRQHSLITRAAAGRPPGATRLGSQVLSIPQRLDSYFEGRSPHTALFRRAMWSGTAFFTGYYSANTVSLSFGALAINDVVAAAVTLAFCEIVSLMYWSAPVKTLKLLLLNCFKLGVIAALMADAMKLGS